ncbi:helix-turn-helix domain-containing protein [Methanothermococcus sp.]|uniref:helix-turn-helix domain-containing protein n=1 Tax=Methanothermococcus sp. TaxID=2614238 RepID=UPI0025DFCFC3|nr:helix-turn-helix domain-containing protein [Methanothermococcus sp.]
MLEKVKNKEKNKSIVIKKTIENIDKSLISNLSNLLSSEVKAKIYIYLRKYGNSTVDEIAHGTGIYPSTIREAILEMYKSGIVVREKSNKEGLGKKPYIYSAVSPSELVKKLSKGLQNKLNEVIMLDKKIKKKEIKIPFLPVKIVVSDGNNINDDCKNN